MIQNAVLPGVYTDVVAGERELAPSTRGVVAIPLEMDWGAVVQEMRPRESVLSKTGYKLYDIKNKLLNEVLKYANKAIVYRLNADGKKAKGTLATGVTVTARYTGTRGNSIKVAVEAVGDTNYSINTYLGTELVNTQIVSEFTQFKNNEYIEVDGTGTLEVATVVLSGGTNGTNTDVDGFLTEIELHEYNFIAYTGTEGTEKNKIIKFVDAQNEADYPIHAVISGVDSDNINIINNTIGLKYTGYDLTAGEACATMASILSKCGIENGATYFEVEGANDVTERLTTSQMGDKTVNGETLFVLKNNRVVVLYDINSRTTVSSDTPEDWKKGLVIRTLAQLKRDLKQMLETRAIGKIRNSEDGRNLIKGMTINIIKRDYVDKGYIINYDSDNITVEVSNRDSVSVNTAVQIADTVDKIYLTITSL